MFEHKAFIHFVDASYEKKHDIVCLTIVETGGSTYQKPGTTMLVNSSHEMIGVLSGGCIEEALVHCCDEVLTNGFGKLVTHDLRLPDDSKESWEEGVGCNGLIKVWLEPFYYAEHYGILGEALSLAKKGTPATLRRTLNEGRKSSASLHFVPLKLAYNEAEKMLSQPINPTLKLLVLGIGMATQALVDMADILGWETCVCDTRHKNLKEIEHADKKIFFDRADAIKTVMEEERFDACIIMSHVFKSDSVYLQTAMKSKTPYIGILGSKERSRKILEFLEDSIVIDERFHAPIGLGIGAKTPQAIALSICAEIEAVKNQRSF